MRGATVTYNGIRLALVHTNSFSRRPIMTPDGVDYLWTECVLNIDAVINAAETAYAGDPPVETFGTIPVNTFNSIKHALSVPRKELRFTNYNVAIFDGPDNLVSDVNNGPFPKLFKINRIDGGAVFRVNFEVTFYVLECNVGALISNRFSQTDAINSDNHLTTRTTNGTAYFRVDLLDNANVVADAFRDEILPKIPFGFKRSVSFTTDTKRNIINYNCVDQEVMVDTGDTGPNGSATFITKIEDFYRQGTVSYASNDLPAGVPTGMQHAALTVRVWGSKLASTWVLTQYAFIIAAGTKLPVNDVNLGRVTQIDFSQSTSDRFVEVTIHMMLNAVVAGPFGANRVEGLKNDVVFPDQQGVNAVPPFDAGTRGTAPYVLLESLLTAACSPPGSGQCNDYYQSSYSSSLEAYCGPPPIVSYTYRDVVPSRPKYYGSQTTGPYPYTNGEINSRYETDHGKIQSPMSAPVQSYVPGRGPVDTSSSPTCSISTATQPMTRRIVTWTCERLGAPPMIPALTSNDPNQVILTSHIVMADMALMPDGETFYFRVSGTYIYAFKRDITKTTNLPFDVPQWIDSQAYGLFSLDGSQSTQHGLIDPPQSSDSAN